MSLAVDGIAVELGGTRALQGLSLDVPTGERVALVGPSGAGKSTLLRVVTGLQRPTRGQVLVDGVDVTATPTHRRGVGLVFQDAALFPHRDVGANVGFGLEGDSATAAARRDRVGKTLALVGLEGMERREVATLSGGEAQRVALARALAPSPRVLLLDEPLGALDGPLRERLQDDLRSLFETLGLTVVHVTHDVAEAFALGDRVAVLRDGTLAQVATPEELWARPADGWVADFLRMQNLRRDGDTVTITRPEAVRLGVGDDAVVIAAERVGGALAVRVRRHDGEELEAVTTALEAPRPGDRVSVVVDPAGVVEVPAWRDPER